MKDTIFLLISLSNDPSGTGKTVTRVFSLDKGEDIIERNEILFNSPLFNLQFVSGTILRDQK